MNRQMMLLGTGSFALLALAAGFVLLEGMRREKRVRQRLRSARGETVTRQAALEVSPGSLILRWIAAMGSKVAGSGLLPARTLAELEETLVASGLRGRNGLGLFVGSKILLTVCGPVLALLITREVALPGAIARLLPFAAGAAGLLLPDAVVRRNRQRYLARVERGVPDTLDMLVICAQAGLGLEPAMRRVSDEIVHAHPEIARELAQTTSELRISVDSHRALTALGARTGLDSLKRVTSTLAQTLQYGTPLTEALRTLSAEMRQLTLTRYEGRAARLPVLLTMPMILFIFPCVFIVIGGPAVLQLMKAFSR
jgi:tight adherence protein C